MPPVPPSKIAAAERFDIIEQFIKELPFALIGSAEQIADKLERLREDVGISHYVIRDKEASTPVAALLAGAASGRAPVNAPRFLPRWEVAEHTGAVVAVDVLRAFTTAAYAFAAGRRRISLSTRSTSALAFKTSHPHSLAMGEDRGRRVEGFDFSNSPVEVAGRSRRPRAGATDIGRNERSRCRSRRHSLVVRRSGVRLGDGSRREVERARRPDVRHRRWRGSRRPPGEW